MIEIEMGLIRRGTLSPNGPNPRNAYQLLPLTSINEMPKPLSEDLRKIIIYMNTNSGLKAGRIAELTGMSRRTISMVLQAWRLEGHAKLPERHRGRPRLLDFTDTKVSSSVRGGSLFINNIQFLLDTIDKRGDLYLSELRDTLQDRCGTVVCETTVWRTLKRAGFRMKEVCPPLKLDVSLMIYLDNETRTREERSSPRPISSSYWRKLYRGAACVC